MSSLRSSRTGAPAVLAASRLWLASTAPAVSPSQRAHAIADGDHRSDDDLALTLAQVQPEGFELYVTDACLCGAMRDILRRPGSKV